MKNICLFALVPFLGACSICPPDQKPDQVVVTEYKYVNRKIPTEFLEVYTFPTSPANVNDERELSLWLIDNETYIKRLEAQILKIKEYNEKE